MTPIRRAAAGAIRGPDHATILKRLVSKSTFAAETLNGGRFLPRHSSARTFTLFKETAGGLLSALFPTACPLCAAEVRWSGRIGICQPCLESVEPWQGAICSTCGLPIASPAALPDGEGLLCAACRNHTYSFDVARSYGLYTRPLRDLILHLKFRGRERWGRRLGELLAPLALQLEIMATSPLIAPIPLHSARKRERGYNQAALLADGLQSKLRVPRVETRLLARARHTASQSGLTHSARQENVRGAFRVERRLAEGRNVLLVDDVMTTGATASACAAALKRAGSGKVAVLTLARSTPWFPDLHPVLASVDVPPGVRR